MTENLKLDFGAIKAISSSRHSSSCRSGGLKWPEGPNMGSNQPQTDELHAALHERLVQTGEWHRIMASLRAALDESGWTATLRDRANGQSPFELAILGDLL